MFGFNFIVVLPLLAKFTFGGGAGLYSLFTALMSVGSLAGALFSASRTEPTAGHAGRLGRGLRRPHAGHRSGAHGLAGRRVLVAVGMAMMLFMATANTTLQLNSDPAMRGRVMALYGLLFAGSTPVGGPLLGWISEAWGPRVGLASAGSSAWPPPWPRCAGCGCAGGRRRWRRARPTTRPHRRRLIAFRVPERRVFDALRYCGTAQRVASTSRTSNGGRTSARRP